MRMDFPERWIHKVDVDAAYFAGIGRALLNSAMPEKQDELL